LRVVIVGDIDRSGAIETVESVFGALPPGERSAATDRIVPRRLAAEVVVAKEQPLATAAFGTEGVPVDHADFPALLVLKQIVGSGDFDSTLMEEIRVKRGLAYSVSLSLLNDQTASIVLGGMGTKNENMTAALGVLREVLARIAKEGPGEAQFENAKRYLTGSYLLDFDTNAKLAGSLLRLLLDRRRPEYIEQRNRLIEKVTLADVRRVAARVLDPARLNVTVVGKLASQR
jgi:zinc protease